MQNPRFPKYILILILLLVACRNLLAQEEDRNTFLNRASQYYLGAKDEILIKVNIWGYVQKPGQYLIPRHTDLISLISFAGGPKDGARLTEVRIIREGSLEMNGNSPGDNGKAVTKEKVPILTVDVKKYLETGESGVIPVLQTGDTVLIGQTFGSKFRNVIGIGSVVGAIAAAATIALIIERL